VNGDEFKRNVHVGDLDYNMLNLTARSALAPDMMTSALRSLQALIDAAKYRIVVMAGQFDLTVTHVGVEKMLESLKWKHGPSLPLAKRVVWKVGENVAGYVKSSGNFSYVLVRNAGHLIPADQPEWSYDLLRRIVNGANF
jgi:vitellogenic carboxypeptidase-like protein